MEDFNMKIAVTYDDGEIFQHFGKTEFFKVYEAEDNQIISSEVIGSNGTGHGALAGLLADQGIDVLICGGIGGGAQAALDEAGVKLCAGVHGDADEAAKAYLNGELVSTGANCDHHHHEEGHLHDGEAYPDPHIWCSPRLARRMVETMYRALTEIDPDGASVYAENYARIDRRFAQLDSVLTDKLRPFKGKAFAVYHPTLSYWAADYGLRQLALEPDGKSPSPQYLRAMVDSARHVGVEVVFIQQEFDPRQAETFAREVGCRTEIINPLAYTWSEEIMRIADAFIR